MAEMTGGSVHQNQSEQAEMSRSFQRAIKKAQENVKASRRNFKNLCETRNGENFSERESNRESNMIAELVHMEKNLKGLSEKYQIFLQNPETYLNCVVCGERISAERHKEVPQTRHCVRCKNGNDNGNGNVHSRAVK